MILKDYFDKTLNLISKSPSINSDHLQIAGRNVLLNTPSDKLRGLFLPSISHLISEKNSNVDFTIWYADNASLTSNIKAPDWRDVEFNAQGFAPDLDQEDYQIFFQPWLRQVYLYSRKHKTAVYWVNSVGEVPWWETTFSFRILFHLWTQDLPSQLIHSGAIASSDGDAWLITGPSGSGKSTTCMNLLNAGFKYLGDDYIWIELGDTPKVCALYQTAKLEADNFHERFYSWKEYLLNPETYMDQKAIFNMYNQFREQWLSEAPVKGILLPVVTGKEEGSIYPTNPSRAFMAIAPTTLHHLPHNRATSYQKIKNITLQLPTYEWSLSTETSECVRNFKTLLRYG